MVELITVMIIVGILAAVAMPKFFERGTYDSRGFADEVKATLRYAQKAAIAQRRFVCVNFTSTNISLTYDVTGPSATHTVAACTLPLTLPFEFKTLGDARMAGYPTTMTIDAIGRPSAAQTINIQVNGATEYTVKVEAETGYVH